MAKHAERDLAVAICHLPFANDHWPFAILADLSSTRRSMWIYHLSGDLCGSIIHPAIYADLLYTQRSMQIYHLSGDLCGPIIYPAIYEEISSIAGLCGPIIYPAIYAGISAIG